MTALDSSSLGKAITQLRSGLDTFTASPENDLYRDGVIQQFEFTYSLCSRMLARYLEQTAPVPDEIEQMSFATLVPTGAERGILKSGWDQCQAFREARNITSHTYNQVKAEQVMNVVPDFLAEAEFLYEQLQQRNR